MFIRSRDSSRIACGVERGMASEGEEGGRGREGERERRSVDDDGYIIERIVSFFSDDDVVYIVGASDVGYRMLVLRE